MQMMKKMIWSFKQSNNTNILDAKYNPMTMIETYPFKQKPPVNKLVKICRAIFREQD